MAIGWPHPPSRDETTESKTLEDAGLFSIPGSLQKYDPSSKTWSEADSEEQQVPMLVLVDGVGQSSLTPNSPA